MFGEGDVDCVDDLLKPAKVVIDLGRDIFRESYEERFELCREIEENYRRYRKRECGVFLRDLDSTFRGYFEAALALLALSFELNRESTPENLRGRFREEELRFVDEITKFDILDILSVEDIVRKLQRRDEKVYGLLKTYYLGLDSWVEEQLGNSEISQALRIHFKRVWEKRKQKLNQAIADANRYDWFRNILSEWEREKGKAIEAFTEKVKALENRIRELMDKFEEEKRKLAEDISSKSASEIEALRREKEELIERFEMEKEEIAKVVAELKERELRERLEKELEEARKRVEFELKAVEESLRKKEEELRKRELELAKKEDLVRRKIEEILRMSESVEKGSRLLKAEEAKFQEMNFVGRLKSKLNEVDVGWRKFRVSRLEESKGTAIREKSLPENTIIKAELKEKKIFGGEKLEVFAYYLTRPEKLLNFGFDTEPIELGELNRILDEHLRPENRRIVVLASPLGFESRIKKFLNSKEFYRNFYHQKVSLLLLDIDRNEVIFNPNDEYAKSFSEVVQLEMDEERYQRAKKCVLELISARDYVSLREATRCGEERYVKRAFYEIAEEINGFVKYVEGVGLVLLRR